MECVSFAMRVILVFQIFPSLQNPIRLRGDPNLEERQKSARNTRSARDTRLERILTRRVNFTRSFVSCHNLGPATRCPKPNKNFDFSLLIDFINFQGCLCQKLINGHILSSHRSENKPKLMAIKERTSVHRMVIMN